MAPVSRLAGGELDLGGRNFSKVDVGWDGEQSWCNFGKVVLSRDVDFGRQTGILPNWISFEKNIQGA